MRCVSLGLGCLFHEATDKLCIARNVTGDGKLADRNPEFLSHVNRSEI
jgi:hypothetical protein